MLSLLENMDGVTYDASSGESLDEELVRRPEHWRWTQPCDKCLSKPFRAVQRAFSDLEARKLRWRAKPPVSIDWLPGSKWPF